MEDAPFSRTADAYDLLNRSQGKDYAAEAIELHAQIQSRAEGAATLLDVACGTGCHLEYLRRWYDISGTDIEPAMLAHARARLPGVSFTRADMRTLDLHRRFDAVVCLFSAVGFMTTADDLCIAIGAMARHLEPGGVLIVDGWVRPDKWQEPGSVRVQWGQDAASGMTVARMVRPHREGNRTHLEMHYLVGFPTGVEYIQESQRLTLFTEDDYLDAFEHAGLHVEAVPSPMADRDRYIGTRSRTGSNPVGR
jgi:SAM-dependent methyltransferase